MATQVQFRRGTTVQHSVFTGAAGEVTVDTDKNACVIHDAVTAGGFPLLRDNGSNSQLSLGSLTSCALKFASDPNTGIISPGPDQVSFVTGGVARLTIDSAGAISVPGNVTITGSLTVSGAFDSSENLALIVALG